MRSESVREALAQAIVSEFRPGQRLPSEQALAERLGASRATIRTALEELSSRGLLLRQWGRGTFINPNPGFVDASLADLAPIPRTIEANGHRAAMPHLAYRRVAIPESLRDRLVLADGSEGWEFERLYTADDQPAIFLRDLVPDPLLGRPVDPRLFETDMLTFLARHCRVTLDHALTDIHAAHPDPAAQRHLQVAADAPVLLTKAVGYTRDGQGVIYTEAYQLTNVLSYHFVRHAQRVPAGGVPATYHLED